MSELGFGFAQEQIEVTEMENVFSDNETMPLWEFLDRFEKSFVNGGILPKTFQRQVVILEQGAGRILLRIDASGAPALGHEPKDEKDLSEL